MQAHEAIRQVLMEHWDPIGVRGVPDAVDEYDSYLEGIYCLLALRSPDNRIVEHLRSIERDQMGLRGQSGAHLHLIVDALRKIEL